MLRFLHLLVAIVVLTFLASAMHAQVPDIQGGMLHPQSLPSEIATAQRIRVFRSEGLLSEPERIVFREIAAPKMRPGDSWGGQFQVSLRCGIANGRLILAWAGTGRTAIWFEDGDYARIW